MKDKLWSHYLPASCLGALAGGLVVLVLTRAIPKLLPHMGSTMMKNMMAEMQASGCDPAEF